MGRRRTGRWRTAIAIGVLVWSGCGGEASGPVLVVDAEYDPDEVSNVSAPILEEPITEIPGAAAQITLTFEKAGAVDVVLPIYAPDAEMPMMEADEMDHGGHQGPTG